MFYSILSAIMFYGRILREFVLVFKVICLVYDDNIVRQASTKIQITNITKLTGNLKVSATVGDSCPPEER